MVGDNKFSYRDSIVFAVNVFRSVVPFNMILLVVLGTVSIAVILLIEEYVVHGLFLRLLLELLGLFIAGVIGIQLIRIAIKITDEGKSRFNLQKPTPGVLLNYFFGIILLSLPASICVFVVVFLLVLSYLIKMPLLLSIFYLLFLLFFILFSIAFSIWFFVRSQFIEFIIIERGMKAMDAMKATFKITEGRTLEVFKLDAALGVIQLCGFLCLGVGLFVTTPIALLAITHGYKKLSESL